MSHSIGKLPIPVLMSISTKSVKRKATVRFKEGGYIISTIHAISNEERRVCIAHELIHILISSLNKKIFNLVLNSDDKNDKIRKIIAQY